MDAAAAGTDGPDTPPRPGEPGERHTPGEPDLIVAVLGVSGRIGGSERGTIETAASDATRGQRWLLALRDTGPGDVMRLCANLGVEHVLVRGSRDVRRLVRARRPTIVYVFGPRWSVPLRLVMAPTRLAARLARRARPRFIVAQRGLDVWRRPWHRWADRFTHRLVDRYVANSQAAADMLTDAVGIPASKVSVLRTGLGDAWFAPPTPGPRARPGVPPHVLIVGNDRPEKALDDAIAALAAVADLTWRATIYTDVDERLVGLVAAAGLAHRIEIVAGHRVTPADYDSADLLLQTSTAESLPRVVLEAVARGVRVLASDVGDTAALLPAGQVFPAGDRAAAAALLRAWIGEGRGEATSEATGEGHGQAGDGLWSSPQPVTVARETDVADALRRLAHEPTR
jgi:glycosyltransferase involved in cell wall biosynthesis